MSTNYGGTFLNKEARNDGWMIDPLIETHTATSPPCEASPPPPPPKTKPPLTEKKIPREVKLKFCLKKMSITLSHTEVIVFNLHLNNYFCTI